MRAIQSVGFDQAILVGDHGTPGSWLVFREASYDTPQIWRFSVGVGPANDAKEAISQATQYIQKMIFDRGPVHQIDNWICQYDVISPSYNRYAHATTAHD